MTAFEDHGFAEAGRLPDLGSDGLARIAAGQWRHACDLDRLLETEPRRWSEALASETRAQLAGCFNAVGRALELLLAPGWLARPVEALGEGYCGRAMESRPELLSAGLVDHMRRRAAVALCLRSALEAPPVFADEAGIAQPLALAPTLAEEIAAYHLSLDALMSPPAFNAPVRADLGAEAFFDLVWSTVALLVEGLVARLGIEPGSAAPALARAAETVIARHDEAKGPFARAASIAAQVALDQIEPMAAAAMVDRDLLLYAMLGARRVGLDSELGLALLLDGGHDERAALAWHLSLPVEAFVAQESMLAPVGAIAGPPLVERVDLYRTLDKEGAAALIARWRVPLPLARRLARIGWPAVQ